MFCDKCDGLIISEDGKSICQSCGKGSKKGISISQKATSKKKIVISKEAKQPIIKERCPKCGHEYAYFWTSQTRSADEAPTRFHKCVKCDHTWREYD
jgi:DNA-directed RNA polymerase subunit M